MEKITYKDFTDEQIKKISNGCGGKGSKFKPPYRLFFEASCDIHDINYYIGITSKDRKDADKGLLKYMKRDVTRIFKWYNPKRYYYLIWCYLYYLTVRLFGGKNFNYTRVITKKDISKIK